MGRGNSICKGTEAQKDDGELEGSVFEGEGRAGVQGPRRDGKKWRKKKKRQTSSRQITKGHEHRVPISQHIYIQEPGKGFQAES